MIKYILTLFFIFSFIKAVLADDIKYLGILNGIPDQYFLDVIAIKKIKSYQWLHLNHVNAEQMTKLSWTSCDKGKEVDSFKPKIFKVQHAYLHKPYLQLIGPTKMDLNDEDEFLCYSSTGFASYQVAGVNITCNDPDQWQLYQPNKKEFLTLTKKFISDHQQKPWIFKKTEDTGPAVIVKTILPKNKARHVEVFQAYVNKHNEKIISLSLGEYRNQIRAKYKYSANYEEHGEEIIVGYFIDSSGKVKEMRYGNMRLEGLIATGDFNNDGYVELLFEGSISDDYRDYLILLDHHMNVILKHDFTDMSSCN